MKRNSFQRATLKHRRRVPIYLLSFTALVSLNILAAQTHYNDDYFFYCYPFPFALDIGHGPSMLPTMDNAVGNNLYWRDCWSHRLVWLNWDHVKSCASGLLSEQPTNIQKISFKRPWQKGDIVTIYNPFTKSIVTKRIIGVGGDTIQVFGEYAHKYHAEKNDVGNSCGVPDDARFPMPVCLNVWENAKATNISDCLFKPGTVMIVPPNHVWVEGDNPLHSTDSRHYGPLPESALRGRVVMRLWPVCTMPLTSKRPVPFMNNEWMKEDRHEYGDVGGGKVG